MAAHMNPPPVGSQVPLDRERSGHANSPSSMQYGKYFFKCYYRIGSGSRDFMTLSWTHGQHQGPVEFMPCANRLEGGQFGGSFSFLSSTHFVQAKVNGNCFDPQENEAVVRRYIRQLEPLARTCSGAAAPAPTATPTPSTSGCSLQGAWYQFGSGTVEFTGNEHELRGTLAHGHTWDWVKTLEYKNGEHIFTVRKSGHCTYEGTMKFRWPTDPPAWFPVQLAVSGDSLEIKFLQEPKTTLYSFKGTYERVSR